MARPGARLAKLIYIASSFLLVHPKLRGSPPNVITGLHAQKSPVVLWNMVWPIHLATCGRGAGIALLDSSLRSLAAEASRHGFPSHPCPGAQAWHHRSRPTLQDVG